MAGRCTVVLAANPRSRRRSHRAQLAQALAAASAVENTTVVLSTAGELCRERGFAAENVPGDRLLVTRQVEGPLVSRVQKAMRAAFDHGFASVCLIVSGIPGCDPRILSSAFDSLERAAGAPAAVVGPCRNGQTFLFAINRNDERPLDSTRFRATPVLERLHSLGYRVERLASVDTDPGASVPVPAQL